MLGSRGADLASLTPFYHFAVEPANNFWCNQNSGLFILYLNRYSPRYVSPGEIEHNVSVLVDEVTMLAGSQQMVLAARSFP